MEDNKFKVMLNYRAGWRLALTTCDPVSRKRKKKIAKLKMIPESCRDKDWKLVSRLCSLKSQKEQTLEMERAAPGRFCVLTGSIMNIIIARCFFFPCVLKDTHLQTLCN